MQNPAGVLTLIRLFILALSIGIISSLSADEILSG
jgi:hypothetical protein